MIDLAALLGPDDPTLAQSLAAANAVLREPVEALLRRVGQTLPEVPPVRRLDKRSFPSFHRNEDRDDLLAARGAFLVTEAGRLLVDCTAGHYQMAWGYGHPEIVALVEKVLAAGIPWEGHAALAGAATKRLAERLVAAANDRPVGEALADPEALGVVHLGTATGSAAVAAALRLALRHRRTLAPRERPAFVVLAGNYHGTDFLAQRLRGMWPSCVTVDVEQVEPNDAASLRRAFERRGIAALLIEPALMSREVAVLRPDFLGEARRLCDLHGALLIVDEVQTGFWHPDVFSFRRSGIVPDAVVAGKGMTAGFHPLAAVLYRRRHDRLEPYDAFTASGHAPLAATVALGCLDLLERDGPRIDRVGQDLQAALGRLVATRCAAVVACRGVGLMAGLELPALAAARAARERALARGLWLRVHETPGGRGALVMKLPLIADEALVDFVVGALAEILDEKRDAGSSR